MIPKERRKK